MFDKFSQQPFSFFAVIILGAGLMFIASRRVPINSLVILIFSVFFSFSWGKDFIFSTLMFFAFFIFSALSTLFSPTKRRRAIPILLSFAPLIGALILGRQGLAQFKEQPFIWIQMAVVCYMSAQILSTRRQLYFFLYWILAFFALSSALYLIHRLGVSLPAINIFHRNFMASQIGLYILLFSGFYFYETDKIRKKFILCSLAVGLLALYSTASRWGVFTCLCCLLVVIFIFTKREKYSRKRIILCLFGLAAIFYLSAYFLNNKVYLTMFSIREKSFIQRLEIYYFSLLLLRHNLFFGIGSGFFRYYTFHSYTHNFLLEIGVSAGAVGLSAFIFLIWRLVGDYYKRARLLLGGYKYLFRAGLGALLFYLMHNMLDYNLVNTMGIQLGVILGVLYSLPFRSNDHSDKKAVLPVKLPRL